MLLLAAFIAGKTTIYDIKHYLPLWPSDYRTRPPCAVGLERDALSGRGSTRPGRVRPPKN